MISAFINKINLRSVLLLVVFSTVSFAQSIEHEKNLFQEKHFSNRKNIFETTASDWFDVTYYRLDLEVLTQTNYLKGKVTVTGVCRRNNVQILTLDIVNQMQVDSVYVNCIACNFAQHSSSFDITLAGMFSYGEVLSVDIFYEGLPIPTGFGSFIFNSHSGVPWVYSLSQPFGAKDWWPCKDDPSDKADSADIIITCDSTFKVGSQGILVSVVKNANGTATYHWSERYPIASYLISIAVTNYAQFSNWYKYSATDSMEVLNYVLPEHYTDAVADLPKTVDMLAIFSDLFGQYPFIKEKYGHAEFATGGAMEHQTMTSTTKFGEDLVAHELAHQWFGDMITCRTWGDLWLNEGFAQYSAALYHERQYGMDSYRSYMNTQLDQAKMAKGVIGIPDTTSVRNLFDSRRIYAKGACVLHMLRHVLGDSTFFSCLYAYANNPSLKYSTAVIKDFQSICENVSAKNLEYFFQEWIYGDGFPEYNYSWNWKSNGVNSEITLNVEQAIGKTNPSYFTMPVDIHIKSASGDTIVTVHNNAQTQSFHISYPEKPLSVRLDSEGWILKDVYSENDLPPASFELEQNYPNPFNASTTITYHLLKRGMATLRIYDLLGREIATLISEKQSAGYYKQEWNPVNTASGVYIYRLEVGSNVLQKRMTLIK
jgi:aminopeptidase N